MPPYKNQHKNQLQLTWNLIIYLSYFCTRDIALKGDKIRRFY